MSGPFNIDYVAIRDDYFDHSTAPFFFILAFTWLAYLMLLTESTASRYFSVTMDFIAERMNLPDNLAGVTFLAFGNGAPDFFTIVATINSTGSEVNNQGVGALLGATVFVSTVVVGAVAITSGPFKVHGLTFTRDVLFNIAAASCFLIIAMLQSIYLIVPLLLLSLYAAYVYLVISQSNQCEVVHIPHGTDQYMTIHDTPTEAEIPNMEIDVENGVTQSHHWTLFSTQFMMKARVYAELPSTIMRDVTIPTLDPEKWSHPHAVLHPFAAMLMFSFIFDEWSLTHIPGSDIPLLVVFILVGMMGSAVFYIALRDNRDKPPESIHAVVLWLMLAFVMCVAWMYVLASEVVACLLVLGQLLHIPASFLGLTVLAWSNSISDLFANTAIGIAGHKEMAFAGCYGGPIFNMMVGYGVSLLIVTSKGSFALELEIGNVISISFIMVILALTIVVVPKRGFWVEPMFGYLLLLIYACYTICQFLALFLI